LLAVPVAVDGTRRERITATLAAMAAAFESLIADAPEQWSAVFFPIWQDLAAPDALTAPDAVAAGIEAKPAPSDPETT
jgi:hypothetical protein